MRIVYNLRDQDWQTTKSLGILHVSTRILAGLTELPNLEAIDVLANRSLARQLEPWEKSGRIQLHHVNVPAPRGWSRLLWDQWSLVRACNRLAPDWLLLPKGFSPLLRWPRCRVSAYVHDNVFGYYERLGIQPFPHGQSSLFARMLRRTASDADCIVTNSQFTACEFETGFSPRHPPVRIGAPVPAPPVLCAPAAESSPSTILLPTSAWPHKLSLQAVAWLERWTRDVQFPGRIHGFGTLPPSARRWPVNDAWIHHGRIDDAALAELEAHATILVYFSAYEGFGLPPVEAATAGRRAIASDLPALRETLHPDVLFDNHDYASFARTLSSALSHPPRPPRRCESARDVATRWLDELRRAPVGANAERGLPVKLA